jgi:hypothetical protein
VRQTILVPLLLLGLIGGCTVQPQRPAGTEPVHALLQDVSPPPYNRPARVAPVVQPAPTPPQPRLPPDDQPAVLILRGDQPFSGQLETRGTISISEQSIRFEPDTGTPLTILYRPPEQFAELPRTVVEGRLTVREQSGPAGADRLLLVRSPGGLVFGEIWQRAADPISVEVTPGVRVRQSRVLEGRTEPGFNLAEVDVYDGERPVAALMPGQRARVRTSAGDLEMLLQTSHWFQPSEAEADQYPAEYVLHLWLTSAGAEVR